MIPRNSPYLALPHSRAAKRGRRCPAGRRAAGADTERSRRPPREYCRPVRRPPASGCEGARPGSAAEPQPNHASGRRWTASPANEQLIYHKLECALFVNYYSANTKGLNKLGVYKITKNSNFQRTLQGCSQKTKRFL
jgi:hypothetical protein